MKNIADIHYKLRCIIKFDKYLQLKRSEADDNMPTEQNKLWDDYGAPFLDLRILLNNKRSGLLDNTMHANFIAENTARVILSKETIDFSTEGEDFFNYVWDRFGFDVYRAMLGIVKEQLPTSVLVNILDNFMLRMTMLQGQTHSTQVSISLDGYLPNYKKT